MYNLDNEMTIRHRNSGIGLLIILVFILFTNISYAQMYSQMNLQYSYYDYRKPLNLTDVRPNIAVGIGVMIFANQKSKFELVAELNSFSRNFHQKYGQTDFRYNFSGFEIRLLANYFLTQKVSLEGGGIAADYSPGIYKNGETLDVGKGFRGKDFGVFLGCHYFFTKSWVLGARFDFWFVKMLEYNEIGDYGELGPAISDIQTNTAEIFIRFQFLNKWK